MPAISVIMPVFNAAPYLPEAMESIINQSFDDFEFLIYNDGSEDNSLEIINSYRDSRIKLFHNKSNQGYVELLNRGIHYASGKYIARMDADDIAHPQRLKRQYEFLEAHNDYIVCGSRFNIIGSKNIAKLPIENDDIKLRMLYITPFCHPSILLRTAVLHRHNFFYDHNYMPAEDRELWGRLSTYGKFHNLPESLMQYRVHNQNISRRVRTENQRVRLIYVEKSYISEFFKETRIKSTEVDVLHKFFFCETGFSLDELRKIGTMLQRIIDGNVTYPVEQNKVHSLLSQRYFYCCTTSTHLGLKSFSLANHYSFTKISLRRNIFLLIKSVLRYKKLVDKYVRYTRNNW